MKEIFEEDILVMWNEKELSMKSDVREWRKGSLRLEARKGMESVSVAVGIVILLWRYEKDCLATGKFLLRLGDIHL